MANADTVAFPPSIQGALIAAKCPESIRDFSGQTFNGLRVLSYVGKNPRNQPLWRCICVCGQERIIQSRQIIGLKSGRCLCVPASLQDITGQRFGLLVALEPRGVDKRKKRLWLCRCDCGETKILSAHTLITQGIKSCGCIVRDRAKAFGLATRKDLTGMKFGRLTVVGVAEETVSSKNLKWLCVCDCGRSHKVRGNSLKTLTTISCGCATIDHPGLTSPEVRKKRSVGVHKRRALARSAPGSFTAADVEELYRKQKGKCAEPTCKSKLRDKFHRDHIIPLKLKGTNHISNIQLLCPKCNMRKNRKDPLRWAAEMGRLL